MLVWNRGRTDAIQFVAARINDIKAQGAESPARHSTSPATPAPLSVDDRLTAAIERRFRQQATGKVD